MEGRARQERKHCLLGSLAEGENHIKCEALEVDIFQLMLLDVPFRMYENVKCHSGRNCDIFVGNGHEA